jgi:hypothetical protein
LQEVAHDLERLASDLAPLRSIFVASPDAFCKHDARLLRQISSDAVEVGLGQLPVARLRFCSSSWRRASRTAHSWALRRASRAPVRRVPTPHS